MAIIPPTTAPRRRRWAPWSLAQFYKMRFKIEMAMQFAYRGSVLIWLLSLIVQPLISLVVWRTVANSQGGSAGGYTASDYAAYFIAVMIVNQMTFMWHMWEMEWRIRTGFYSPILLRPLHPIHEDIVGNLSFKLLTLIPLLPVAVILSIVFDAHYPTSLRDVIAFVPALILAIALRYMVEWTFGLLAFWMTKVTAFYQLFGSLSFFLAGQVAPLSLFPKPVQIIASVLPFRWTLSFPVEAALGRLSDREIVIGLGMQVLWLGIAIVLMRIVWSRATRRYSAVGG